MQEIKDKIRLVLNEPERFNNPDLILRYLYKRLEIIENGI